jgi:hypothetical protein
MVTLDDAVEFGEHSREDEVISLADGTGKLLHSVLGTVRLLATQHVCIVTDLRLRKVLEQGSPD